MKKLNDRELEMIIAVKDSGNTDSSLTWDSNYEIQYLRGSTKYGQINNVGYGIFLVEVHISGDVDTGGKGIRKTWYEYVSLTTPNQNSDLFQNYETTDRPFSMNMYEGGNLHISWSQLPKLTGREWWAGSTYFTIYKVGGDV